MKAIVVCSFKQTNFWSGYEQPDLSSLMCRAKERKNTLLANCVSMSLHRTVDWPDGRPSPAAMNDGSFTHISCRLSKVAPPLVAAILTQGT